MFCEKPLSLRRADAERAVKACLDAKRVIGVGQNKRFWPSMTALRGVVAGVMSDPDVNHVEKALRSAEFLVVQDIFLTQTAELAHVVLPGASFAEKDGTFSNTERASLPIAQRGAASCGAGNANG